MKTTKLYAKKSLSLFMAVMMLLTCWVWVAPEHEHASAASAESVEIENTSILKGIELPDANWNGSKILINTTSGKYFSDDSDASATAERKAEIYKNVIYSGSAGARASIGETGIVGSNKVDSVAIIYPITVLMYDGKNPAQFGVTVRVDAYKGKKVNHWGTSVSSDSLEFVNSDWYGVVGGTSNGKFFEAYYGNNKKCGQITTSSNNTGTYYQNPSNGDWYQIANILRYKGGAMTEYSKTLSPTFTSRLGYYSTGLFGEEEGQAYGLGTATNSVYVIKTDTLLTAYDEAVYIYTDIISNPSKYTPASVATFVKLVNALIEANPNNFEWGTNTATQVSNYAEKAKKAVDAWNDWHTNDTIGGLVLQPYTVTFDMAVGNDVTITKNYGEKINIQVEAYKIENSVKSIDGEKHQLYTWPEFTKEQMNDTPLTDDVTIAEVTDKTELHIPEYTDAGNGKHTVTCEKCNYSTTEAHKAGNTPAGDPTTPPTCNTPGEGLYECEYCDGTVPKEIPATGNHTPGEEWVEDEDSYIPPTCTTEGEIKIYKYCTVCGKPVQNETRYFPAIDHKIDNGDGTYTSAYVAVVTDPTCKTQGFTTYTCSISGCGDTYVSDYVPALGHTESEAVIETVTSADCVNGGTYYEVKNCTVCGEEAYRSELKTTDPLGHDIVIDKAVDPTCTDTGLTEGSHCSRCGEVIKAQDVLPELGHKEGEAKRENYVPATCKADGSYDMVVRCTVCNEILESVHHTIDKGACNFEYTSNGDGRTHTGKCTACGKIDPDNTTCSGGEATCSELAECKDCKTGYGALNPTNHKAVAEIPEKAPTCQVEGYKAHLYCNDCKNVVDENGNVTTKEMIATVAHKYGPWVSNGNDTHTQTCTTCVAANGEISKVTKDCRGGEATCTKQAVCEDCKTAYGPLKAHVYDKEVVHTSYLKSEATCTAQAEYYMSCYCGASSAGTADEDTFKHGELLPHVFTNEERKTEEYLHTAKTCTSYAKYYHSCENCEAKGTTTFRDVESGFAPHSYTNALQKEIYAEISATCTTGGKYYYSCSACGASCKDDASVAEENKLFDGSALGHVYRVERVVVSTATCNTPGTYYNEQTCVRCNISTGDETKLLETPATGKHTFPADWDATASYPATCGEDGLNIKYCTTCSREAGRVVATLEEILPATGIHEFKKDADGNIEWTVKTEPTCNKMGERVKSCANCTYTESEKIDVIGHAWVAPEAIIDAESGEVTGYNFHYDRLKSAATCNAKAVYYKHCATCGMTMGGETYEHGAFDANAHNFGGDRIVDGDKFYFACLNGCSARSESACEFVTIPEDANDDKIKELANKVIKESTCKTPGQVEFWCTKCEAGTHVKVVDLKNVDPANHEGEASIVIGAIDALCNREGYTGDVYYDCCTEVMAKKGETIGKEYALNHGAIVTVPAASATCVADGHEAYDICQYCTENNGKEFVVTEKVIIPKIGHAYGNWEQTVTADGEGNPVYNHVRTCPNCAEGTEGKIQTEACSGGKANCVESAVCATCNTAYGTTDSTNHKSLKVMPEQAPTCQVKGHEAYKYCDAEGCGYSETIVEIDTVDHVYPATWTQAVTEDENGVKSYNHVKVCLTCIEDAEKNLTKNVISEACSGGLAYCNEQATCQVCKTKYGAFDPANHKTQAAHNKENDRVEATCTAPGKEADKLYNCCNALKKQGEVIPQLDHEFTVELTETKIPATCVAKGSVTYKCATCDAEEPRELTVDSKNHASTEILTIGKKDATCTEKGYTGNKYHKCCYDLGKTEAQNKKALIEMGKEIPTNGTHSYSAPVPEYKIDKITDILDDEGKVIGKTITYKTAEPTYAEKVKARHADGKWYHVQQCAECGDVLTKACATYSHTINCVDHDVCDVCEGLCSLIDETSHKFELTVVSGKPATCMADGVKDYYECDGCKKAYLDKAGKTFVDPDTDEGKAALKIDKSTAQHVINWNSPNEVVTGNCGTSGYKVFKCTVEGCTYEARLDTGIVNTIHTWPTTPEGNYVYTTITPATCGTNGYDAIRCSVCQAIKLNSYVITPATGEHDYDVNKDGKVDKNDAVIVDGEDCQSPGTITYTCTKCNYKDVQIDTSGVSAHKWAEDGSDGWKVVGGDCSTGVAYERTCLVCGNSEQKTETSGNHEYIEYERVEPTAEKDGYVIYECKNCKFRTDPEILKYEGNDPVDPEDPDEPEIPDDPEVTKHKFNYDEYRIIEEATCQNAEIREYVCLECGEKVRLPYGEMEDHVWLRQAAEKATCDRDGHSEYYRCVRCLAEDPTEPKEIYPATGHNDGNGDGKCDKCSALLYEGDGGASVCSCMCHKTGFMGFIYKIVSFFWKLFKMNPSCACGNTHY